MKNIFLYFLIFLFNALAVLETAAEPIAIIVNKNNEVNNLSKYALARIYKGTTENWENGEKIIKINRPFSSKIRAEFYEKVLNAKPTKRFYKKGSPIPIKMRVQRSSLATIKVISRIPNAIGYVYLNELTDEVKVLSIDNVFPDNQNYSLK